MKRALTEVIKATPRMLQYWYTRINRTGFGGRLPKARIEVFPDNLNLAVTRRRGDKYTIAFNKRMMFSRTLCVETLVHEMVHVEHWSWNHGTRFSNRIMAVIKKAKLGDFL